MLLFFPSGYTEGSKCARHEIANLNFGPYVIEETARCLDLLVSQN